MRKHKTKNWATAILLLGITSALTLAASALAAQDVAAPADAVAPAAALAQGVITELVGALTLKYGWLVTAISWIGILRATIKPLMTMVEAVVAATPGTADDAAIAKFESGPIWKWTLWAVDLVASIKKPATNTNPLVP